MWKNRFKSYRFHVQSNTQPSSLKVGAGKSSCPASQTPNSPQRYLRRARAITTPSMFTFSSTFNLLNKGRYNERKKLAADGRLLILAGEPFLDHVPTPHDQLAADAQRRFRQPALTQVPEQIG